MFKNPLKYQQGGATPSQEEQKVLVAFIQWLPKRVKEFQGMRPEAIAQALDGMSKTAEGKKQLQQLMMQFQQEMENESQAFKQGGKIHDFICKHARGGRVDCGCKEDGGEIKEAQEGIKLMPWTANGYGKHPVLLGVNPAEYEKQAIMMRQRPMYAQSGLKIQPGFSYLGEYSIKDAFNPRMNHVAWHGFNVNGEDVAVPTKQGAYWSGRDYDSVYNNEGEKTMSRSMFNNLEDFYTRALPESNQVKTLDEEKLAGMENGGKVLKGQRGLSSGKFDIPFGAYMKTYFNKRSTPDVGAATRRSFGYSTSDGNEYYLEDANIGRNSVDTWVNVTPKKDTIIMQKLPSDHINDLEGYQMEAIMQRMRPDIKRVNNQENGGKVEKAETGMSKLEALKKAKETHGYNNSQARFAYANAKNALRNQGLRGRELRQSAREMISRGTREPIVAIDPTSPVQGVAVATLPNGSPLPAQTIVGSREPRMGNNYDNLTFSNAFLAARNKAGGDNGSFNWRGRKYTTKLGANNNRTGNNEYSMPGLAPVVIEDPELTIPEFEPIPNNTPDLHYATLVYPGLESMLNPQSVDFSWPTSTWLANQNNISNLFAPYRVRDKQSRVLMVGSPSLYKPSAMAFKNGGKVEKAQSGGNVNILGKITPYTNPVSTMPMDSSEVVYNPLFRSLVFKDINGNDVSWARNYDGSYRYRNGKDIMDFDPNQDADYIPYSKMKAWGRGTSGSTKLSKTDNENLKNLEDKTRLKKKKNLK